MFERYWPLGAGRTVTSPFGPRAGGFHRGTDFGRPGGSAGMPVYAIQSGTVIHHGAAEGYGGPDPAGWIVIDSDDSEGGGCLEYGHIVRLPHIAIGTKVKAGEQIAVVNPNTSTNGGTAPHLHLSDMPHGYDPAAKQNPLARLVGAKEPSGDVIVSKKEDGAVGRPDFNEYPMWSPNSEDRRGTKVDLFLLHTQEGAGNADSLARWLGNPANAVSYHYTVSQDPVDNGVTVVDVVDTDRAAWAALSANRRSINLVFAGSTVNWSHEQWMKQSKAIDAAAWLICQDAKKYGFPLTVIPPPYTAGRAGVSDHNYVTRVLKDGSHSDVGPNFPWLYLVRKIAEFSGGKPTPPNPPVTKPVTKRLTDRELLEEIQSQLAELLKRVK